MPPKSSDLSAIQASLVDLTEQIRLMNKNLNDSLDKQEKLSRRISEVEILANDTAQHQRSHSVRIFGLQTTQEDNNDPFTVSSQVYEAILPILNIAVECKQLASVPPLLDTIDIAHILPSRSGQNTIICRFRSKLMRLAVLRNKKTYFTKQSAIKFSISDDLTRLNYMLLKKTKENPDTTACWFANGKIKYRIKNDDKTHIASLA